MSLFKPVNYYNAEEDNSILNSSLGQGGHFNKNRNNYDELVGMKRLNLIGETTGPNLGNIEGMDNINYFNSDTQDNSEINALEKEFNDKLTIYTSVYQEYLSKLSTLKEDSLLYANTNVKDSNNKYYVVNQYGVARGYSSDAWNNKHSSCPTNIPGDETVNIFNKLTIGNDKKAGEPCNLEGKVISQLRPLKNSWITPEGRKKWFPSNSIWEAGKKNGCNANPTVVTNDVYNLLDSAEDMDMNANCNVGLGFDDMKNQLEKLNGDLIHTATKIYEHIVSLSGKTGSVNTNVGESQNTLKEHIQKLQKQRTHFEKMRSQQETLKAESDNNNLLIKSSYYQYMIWTIAAITLGAVAVKHVSS